MQRLTFEEALVLLFGPAALGLALARGCGQFFLLGGGGAFLELGGGSCLDLKNFLVMNNQDLNCAATYPLLAPAREGPAGRPTSGLRYRVGVFALHARGKS